VKIRLQRLILALRKRVISRRVDTLGAAN
jgi:hypothetical protein